jgi:hypothetical protein
MTLMMDRDGNVFGGFNPLTWESRGEYQCDDGLKTFLITLKNPQNISARKFVFNAGQEQNESVNIPGRIHYLARGMTLVFLITALETPAVALHSVVVHQRHRTAQEHRLHGFNEFPGEWNRSLRDQRLNKSSKQPACAISENLLRSAEKHRNINPIGKIELRALFKEWTFIEQDHHIGASLTITVHWPISNGQGNF